ncbi:hypothetical protein LXM94_16395 [Rhizobium sp. TRM95111]|uniref:hypothetical protein n=1 Tax=Rhizobium alarense TaxID=2846851 RepID=UPI001F27A038|nr:hypothetical protein [Rhizobium alarense]MCF3641554.1 hypothetical protein [Rhizobium alarense]
MITDRTKTEMSDKEKGDLEDQYKPLGLKAVVAAATQRKPAAPKSAERDVPAVLRDDERSEE